MKFTKMHGCGNDYIYIDCTEEFVENEEKAAIILSDRHFGIGGDGIILIKKGTKADFEMVMYNADGSRGAMCGNGIRCVAKYCYDHKLTDKTTFTIESMGAVKYIDVNVENGEVKSAKVDMGKPSLKASDIPVNVSSNKAIDEPIKILDREFKMTCVSMGNPHAVMFIDEHPKDFDLEKYGKACEGNTNVFPDRVNAEFAKIIDRNIHTLEDNSSTVRREMVNLCVIGHLLAKKVEIKNELGEVVDKMLREVPYSGQSIDGEGFMIEDFPDLNCDVEHSVLTKMDRW